MPCNLLGINFLFSFFGSQGYTPITPSNYLSSLYSSASTPSKQYMSPGGPKGPMGYFPQSKFWMIPFGMVCPIQTHPFSAGFVYGFDWRFRSMN